MRNLTKLSFIILLLMFCISSYGQKNKAKSEFEPYTKDADIEITFKGAPAGKTQLIIVYGNQNIKKDSADADSTGKVVFKDTARYPSGFYYVVYSDNSVVSMLLDKNQHFFIHIDKSDLDHVKTNSAENQSFYENRVYEADLAKRIDVVNAKIAKTTAGTKDYIEAKKELAKLVEEKHETVKGYLKKHPDSFFAAFKSMGQNPILKEPRKPNGDLDSVLQLLIYRDEFWDNYDFNDSRMMNTPVFYNKLNTYLTKLFPQRADSIMKGAKFIMEKADKGCKEVFNFTVNFLAITYRESTVMGGEKIFVYVVDKYFTYEKAFWTDSTNIYRVRAQANALKPSLLGEIGQDINCVNQQGEFVSLYSIKKPIRILFMFNPDCEHCIKETPKLIKLYHKWKDKGVEVYALNVEHEYDKWEKFIKKYNLDWINVIDTTYQSRYHIKYHINNTPGLFILDSKNKIVAKGLMPDQLEPVFEQMLKDYDDNTNLPEEKEKKKN